MKISEQITFSATNILLSLALLSLSAFYTYPGTAAAEDFSSAKERPLIQYDDDDLAPPVVPDTPRAPQPGDIEDPALSPDSAISEPDPLFDQTEPVIEQPEPVVPQGEPLGDAEAEGRGLK